MAVEKGWPSPSLDAPNDVSDYSDHQFVASQIRAHKVTIELYREEARTSADTDLQVFARNALAVCRRQACVKYQLFVANVLTPINLIGANDDDEQDVEGGEPGGSGEALPAVA
jgi:hypothetical protein